MQIISGNIVDIKNREIFWGRIHIAEKKIAQIEKLEKERKGEPFVLPGFIDSHVHIESSLLVPSEFARMAVVHGTVATISDPHEIANVCGMQGVKYMIDNAATVPFKFHFGAPSCVPATGFETAGAELNEAEVDEMLQWKEIYYLSEMMNYPGVLNEDPAVLRKIASAIKYGKPVDGHAPGLRGDAAKKYIDAGISTDHECFTAEEALDKIQLGMKILIREGSAARNFEALADLLNDYSDRIMFCSDDKHPDSLAEGHINQLCARAVKKGIDVFKVLKAACLNPVSHYKMDVGILESGEWADLIVVDDLVHFNVIQTYINGELVAENGRSLLNPNMSEIINHFDCSLKTPEDFKLPFLGESEIPVIEALEGQLITQKLMMKPKVQREEMVSDVAHDLLKIVVVNRYQNAPVAKAFIRNIGIKKGAIASSVAHDSHNIVAVGTNDHALCDAVNAVIRSGGGLSVATEDSLKILELPVAGLMSNENGYTISEKYSELDQLVKSELGSPLRAPFMTLSFMALLVIPHLKLSDKGLFDGDSFKLI